MEFDMPRAWAGKKKKAKNIHTFELTDIHHLSKTLTTKSSTYERIH